MRYILLFLILPSLAYPQADLSFTFWVELSDKGNVDETTYQSADLFSDRAILRREKHNVPLHYSDFPVHDQYLSSLKKMDLQILKKSKWFNGVMICSSDTTLVDSLGALPFVKNIDTLGAKLATITNRHNSKFDAVLVEEHIHGQANNQIEMVGGLSLHNQGFRGQGIHIAVFDAGFGNANELGAFSHLFANDQLLGTWDYVEGNANVYENSYHGMSVLSTMAGMIEGEYVGTSPGASYWLLKTEDPSSETLTEEYNWAIAAEFADSVGVDIINSSLGYTTFDTPSQNHSYLDLDGTTTIISQAATLAARKGMIVCNSAGNSGNKSWKYIGAPADADSILSIGAVDAEQQIAAFSSFGPSADGRVKPNVSAQGSSTAIINRNNGVTYSNGTSFSSPIVAGMTACLWQAHYDKTNMQLIDAIIRSAHLYQSPNNQYGYGIPNFSLANAILSDKKNVDIPDLAIYPNPAFSETTISIYTGMESNIEYVIFDLQGKLLQSEQLKWNYSTFDVKLPMLESGMYFIKVNTNSTSITQRFSVLH